MKNATKQITIGKKTIYFRENPYHRFEDEQGNKIESVTSFTGIIDKSRPLIYWATNLARDYLLPRVGGITREDIANIALGNIKHLIRAIHAGKLIE